MLTLLFYCPSSYPANPRWQISSEQSRLGFTAYYDGRPFEGEFHSYQVEVEFDPQYPDRGELKCIIETASVDTKNRERDEALRLQEWFNSTHFPQATFRSLSIRKHDESSFNVNGELTLKGQTRIIDIPFQWNPVKQQAERVQLTASTRIDRRDFNIGSGEWNDDETIGFEVDIVITLMLKPT